MLWKAIAWKQGSFSMNIQPDFEDFLKLLETHEVDYMIVGGYAVAFHGYPRFTKDIDIFFDVSPTNVDRVRQVLIAFGFMDNSIPKEALQTPGNVLAIGVPPVRPGSAAGRSHDAQPWVRETPNISAAERHGVDYVAVYRGRNRRRVISRETEWQGNEEGKERSKR